jgi:hypothetical protein
MRCYPAPIRPARLLPVAEPLDSAHALFDNPIPIPVGIIVGLVRLRWYRSLYAPIHFVRHRAAGSTEWMSVSVPCPGPALASWQRAGTKNKLSQHIHLSQPFRTATTTTGRPSLAPTFQTRGGDMHWKANVNSRQENSWSLCDGRPLIMVLVNDVVGTFKAEPAVRCPALISPLSLDCRRPAITLSGHTLSRHRRAHHPRAAIDCFFFPLPRCMRRCWGRQPNKPWPAGTPSTHFFFFVGDGPSIILLVPCISCVPGSRLAGQGPSAHRAWFFKCLSGWQPVCAP